MPSLPAGDGSHDEVPARNMRGVTGKMRLRAHRLLAESVPLTELAVHGHGNGHAAITGNGHGGGNGNGNGHGGIDGKDHGVLEAGQAGSAGTAEPATSTPGGGYLEEGHTQTPRG